MTSTVLAAISPRPTYSGRVRRPAIAAARPVNTMKKAAMGQPMDRTPDPQRTGEPFEGEREKVNPEDVIDGQQDRGGKVPPEQSPGHDHDNPDQPDEVHPALKADDPS